MEKYTKTWTWGAAGNWLLCKLGSHREHERQLLRRSAGAAQRHDSACASRFREPNDTTDYMQFTCFDVRSLSGTKKLDVDYRSENAAATAKIKTVRFCGVSLDD